jgi:hypothetical protein
MTRLLACGFFVNAISLMWRWQIIRKRLAQKLQPRTVRLPSDDERLHRLLAKLRARGVVPFTQIDREYSAELTARTC